jgi:hypothetical protein
MEPLLIIAKDDPGSCTIYSKDNGLLDTPGWKQKKSIAKHQKQFTQLVNQAKLRSYNIAPQIKNGYQIPRNYDDAIRLAEQNCNILWQD